MTKHPLTQWINRKKKYLNKIQVQILWHKQMHKKIIQANKLNQFNPIRLCHISKKIEK